MIVHFLASDKTPNRATLELASASLSAIQLDHEELMQAGLDDTCVHVWGIFPSLEDASKEIGRRVPVAGAYYHSGAFDKQIKKFAETAASAGDLKAVAICEIALRGCFSDSIALSEAERSELECMDQCEAYQEAVGFLE